VFGRTAVEPFTTTNLRARALKAWAKTYRCGCAVEKDEEETPLEKCSKHDSPRRTPIGLHECRHSYVSLMHDAGFSLERIGDYIGHSSTYMTDHYRHLLDGHEQEAADMFEAYLEQRASGAHRGARLTAVAAEAHR
jgi:integrase